MANLGAVLGWKFNHTPGIRTENNIITDWPTGVLGPQPTPAQISTYSDEYDAAMTAIAQAQADKEAAKTQDIIDNLPSWDQVETAINACDTIAKLRTVVKKIARITYWLAKDSVN